MLQLLRWCISGKNSNVIVASTGSICKILQGYDATRYYITITCCHWCWMRYKPPPWNTCSGHVRRRRHSRIASNNAKSRRTPELCSELLRTAQDLHKNTSPQTLRSMRLESSRQSNTAWHIINHRRRASNDIEHFHLVQKDEDSKLLFIFIL